METVASHTLVACTEVQGRISLVDCYYVGVSIHESAGEVVSRQHGVAGLPGALTLGVGHEKTCARGVLACSVLWCFVKLGLGGFCFVSLEDWARWHHARTAFKLARDADAVVKELEGLSYLVQPVVGEELVFSVCGKAGE